MRFIAFFSLMSVVLSEELRKDATTEAPPTKGDWVFDDHDDNYTCIHMVGGISLKVDDDGKMIDVTVPGDAHVDRNESHCRGKGSNDEKLTLEFEHKYVVKNKTEEETFFLEFTFTNDTSTKDKDTVDVSVCLKWVSVPKSICSNGSIADLQVDSSNSFKCNAEQNYNITDTSGENFLLTLKDFQYQAFLANTTKFSKEASCAADSAGTDPLVPIVVGACLAALVVIVLIAYLVARARARRATGYESV